MDMPSKRTNERSAALVSRASSNGSSPTTKRIVVGAVIVALILGVGLSIGYLNRTDSTPSMAIPQSAANGVIRFGPADATVDVTVIEDFQCPHCKDFEAMSGGTLAGLVTEGVAVSFHPISILDRASTSQYSTRAASAAYCVADADVARWRAWHEAVFVQQPAEGGAGLANEKLVDIARQVGVTGDSVTQCITSERYSDFVTSKTAEVLDSGVSGTPTVLVNGQQVVPNPAAIRAAVDAAR
jgi:protein-disulfide isomerase